jgi:prepilin-type N-terminal cleavage/methylation domain-containing protein
MQSERASTHRRAGFTLVELLVVIGVIAILAAILFPVLSAARESARLAACRSNLRQIGVAIKSYMQDYDDKFPDLPARPGTSGGDQHYFGAAAKMLLPYAKDKKVFRCFSQPERPPEWDTATVNGHYCKQIQTYTWTNERGQQETIRCDYEFEMGVEMLDGRSLDYPVLDNTGWGLRVRASGDEGFTPDCNKWNPAAFALVCDYPCNYHTVGKPGATTWPFHDANPPHRGGMCVLFADFHIIWTSQSNDTGRNSFDGDPNS